MKEGTRTYEKVLLQNPDTKTIMLKYSYLCATFSCDQYISLIDAYFKM